ncbi:hypothetical protein QYF61_025584 [Mycteria americana]|uniref:Uncharacterized protein n=1 Tax=Mycteria americana TaxID=33587 RepID=A0AAN7N3I3_MYCAM|nr:hypothetical protein QYF61_025584 [Mycteria americana]
MSHQCACSKGGQQTPGPCLAERCQQVEGGDPSSLLSTGETQLGPGLGSPAKQRQTTLEQAQRRATKISRDGSTREGSEGPSQRVEAPDGGSKEGRARLFSVVPGDRTNLNRRISIGRIQGISTRNDNHGWGKTSWRMTGFMAEGKAVGVVDFSKAFDTLFHNIPVSKFGCHSLDESSAGWVNNWLGGHVQRVMINEFYPTWELETTMRSVLGPVLLNIFTSDLEEATEHSCTLQMTPNWGGSQYTREQGHHPEVRRNAKSCTWEGRTSCNNTGWGLTAWGAALWLRTKSLGRQQAEHGPAVCPGSRGGQQPPGLFGPPKYRKDTDKPERVHWRPPRWLGLEHLPHRQRLMELVQSGGVTTSGGPNSHLQYLQGGHGAE